MKNWKLVNPITLKEIMKFVSNEESALIHAKTLAQDMNMELILISFSDFSFQKVSSVEVITTTEDEIKEINKFPLLVVTPLKVSVYYGHTFSHFTTDKKIIDEVSDLNKGLNIVDALYRTGSCYVVNSQNKDAVLYKVEH